MVMLIEDAAEPEVAGVAAGSVHEAGECGASRLIEDAAQPQVAGVAAGSVHEAGSVELHV
jgi:hypothetical protein